MRSARAPDAVAQLGRSVKSATVMRVLILSLMAPLMLKGADIRYFDPGIFGKSANEPVTLLTPGKPEALHPFTIMTDIKEGRYFAATVSYPKKVTLDEARDALNQRYKNYEKASFATNALMGLWRNEDDRHAIQLTENDDAIQVIYISFMKFSETWKHLETVYPKESPIEVLQRKLEPAEPSVPSTEPDGPANGSQTIRSETNRTSSADGSRR